MADQNQTRNGANEPAAATADPVAPATSGARTAKTPTVKANAKSAPASPPATSSHVQPRRAERRPEMVRQRRDERRKEYERRKRQWLYTRIALGVVGVAVVGGLTWGIIQATTGDDPEPPPGVQTFSHQANDHTADLSETVQYNESPPTGGRHAPAPFWQNCGYYDAPVQNESAVHSLEHGAVWITYRADALSEDQVGGLRDQADKGYVLVSPYPEQAEPVVLTAWGNQLRLSEWNEDTINQFVRYFRDGPQAPEPGAACAGGVGEPL